MNEKTNTTIQVDSLPSPTSTLTAPLPDPAVPGLRKVASDKNGAKGSTEKKKAADVEEEDDEFGGIQRIFKKGPYSPENTAWLPSRVTLWWLNGFFWRGYKKRVEEDDLYEMLDHDKAKGKEPSLLRAI
ncbi:hypothetical protein BG015_003069, partial [Linnemannia schmuckeri]